MDIDLDSKDLSLNHGLGIVIDIIHAGIVKGRARGNFGLGGGEYTGQLRGHVQGSAECIARDESDRCTEVQIEMQLRAQLRGENGQRVGLLGLPITGTLALDEEGSPHWTNMTASQGIIFDDHIDR